MTHRPTLVSSSLTLRLLVPGSSALPIRSDLRYDALDPYAVTVSFHTGSQAPSDVVQWTFARELLGTGMVAPAGEGDVQVWPSTSGSAPVVCLSLSSPSGRALFEVPRPDLQAFLDDAYATVPSGGESGFVDVDAEFALLLWAEPET